MTVPISYRKKYWRLSPHQGPACAALAQAARCHPIVAQMLLNRGITTPEAAAFFLHPEFKNIYHPNLLPNMQKAVQRIGRTVAEKQKIILFGDYDVDGITGTAMLWHTLTAAGASVEYYIPHRVEEGYGLSCEAVKRLIDDGAQLIISIDCGASAYEPIALAKARIVDVIVSDHHEFPPAGGNPPPAYAVVHPRLSGHPAYPNPDLCGAGVAFKLAWALAVHFSGGERVSATYRELLVEFAALVGLGTIADVVPLVGENRIIARYGLLQLPRTKMTGLKALIASAGYKDRALLGMDVGFGLAPRLNAAGRMGHAHLAVELLTTATAQRAAEIADYLEEQNGDRQATERKIVANAKAQIAALEELPAVLVICHETFHAGVVGIVASRLVETYQRPAFVLASNGLHAHGSARSMPGFPLHEAIESCRDLLISGGGHAMAGGVKLLLKNVDAFRQRLNDYAQPLLGGQPSHPSLPVDAVLAISQTTVQLVTELAGFEPHGAHNPQPRFLLENSRITAPPRRVGKTGGHLQLQIAQGHAVAKAIAFGMGELEPQLPVGAEVDLVVEPRLNTFNGYTNVELHVIDIAKSDKESFAPAEARFAISQ